MKYPDADTMIQSFARTWRVIHRQTEGLSNADSLIQLPFRGNCLNWVLGHILVGRNRVLELLGEPQLWGEAEKARYRTGSDPVTIEAQALPLERLLADLDRSQEQIAAALESVSPAYLAEPEESGGDDQSRGQAVAFHHWHETYHTGQLELLRQLAGKNDAII
jgi:uncharacterized damage-inducible protein DinB